MFSTTHDTTGTIKASLQVNCRFQVSTTHDTTALIKEFLHVNCRFRVYPLPIILQDWLEHQLVFRYQD